MDDCPLCRCDVVVFGFSSTKYWMRLIPFLKEKMMIRIKSRATRNIWILALALFAMITISCKTTTTRIDSYESPGGDYHFKIEQIRSSEIPDRICYRMTLSDNMSNKALYYKESLYIKEASFYEVAWLNDSKVNVKLSMTNGIGDTIVVSNIIISVDDTVIRAEEDIFDVSP